MGATDELIRADLRRWAATQNQARALMKQAGSTDTLPPLPEPEEDEW